MRKRVLENGYKPRYYKGDKVITGDHVARFYGACLCRMIHGGRSIEQIFSTREIMDAVPSIRESMTKSCLEDLTTCLHYSDDWDPECGSDWDDIYDDPKVPAPPGTAKHRLKHGLLEDGYNKVCTVVVVVVVVVVLNRLLTHTFLLLLLLLLLSRGGKLLSTLASGSPLMRVELGAGIIVA